MAASCAMQVGSEALWSLTWKVGGVAVGAFALYGVYKAGLEAYKHRESIQAVARRGEPLCIGDKVFVLPERGIRPIAVDDKPIEALQEEIRADKEKAGYFGPYDPSLVQWREEISALTDLKKEDDPPTSASPKNELIYNHKIARGVTDAELNKLSQNVAAFSTLALISLDQMESKERPNVKEVIEPSEFLELIAEENSKPKPDVWKAYSSYCQNRFKWGFWKSVWHSFKHWCLFRPVSRVIQTFFQRALDEIRVTTDNHIQSQFEKRLSDLEIFLKDYQAGTTSESLTEGKTISVLCKELAPLLVDEFVPRVFFFEQSSKLPFVGFLFRALDATVGKLMDYAVKEYILKRFLPGILESLSANIQASLKADGSEEEAVNYKLATPIMEFINIKLRGFLDVLKDPSPETDLPTPPGLAKKLEGVIGEILKLSKVEMKDPKIREGLRNGLIDGGYQLMKFLQNEPEVILQQLIKLSGICFEKPTASLDLEEEKKKYAALREDQTKLISQVGDQVFEIEAQKMFVGDPAAKVRYHHKRSHHVLKRYLEEGLSDLIGLKSCLSTAAEDLKNPHYQGFDKVIENHFVFWEGFTNKLREVTAKHYPKAANTMLKKEFSPVCQEGQKQIQSISKLQEDWMLYIRHRSLEKNFSKMHGCLTNKKFLSSEFTHFGDLLEDTDTLLPSGSPEVRLLRLFAAQLPLLEKQEKQIKDLKQLQLHAKYWQTHLKDAKTLTEIESLFRKSPSLKQDVEISFLYSEAKASLSAEKIKALLFKVEEKMSLTSQLLKKGQLYLLHQIYPSSLPLSFNGPLSFVELTQECGKWILKTQNAYQGFKDRNLNALQTGVEDLQKQMQELEKTVQTMHPQPLHFPWEAGFSLAQQQFGSLGEIPILIQPKKQSLNKELEGVIAGIRPLVLAGAEGAADKKPNLYAWVEKLALYEIINHLKDKNYKGIKRK
jgi:hypothetical protein